MLLKIQSVCGLKSNHSCTRLPLAEQLSPSLSQPLANSLASFFCQKIVALKESISSKLHGRPSPFDFDQPHATELLSDFAPVTRLLHSMSNKSSRLCPNFTSEIILSSSPILQTYHSPRQLFLPISNLIALLAAPLTRLHIPAFCLPRPCCTLDGPCYCLLPLSANFMPVCLLTSAPFSALLQQLE